MTEGRGRHSAGRRRRGEGPPPGSREITPPPPGHEHRGDWTPRSGGGPRRTALTRRRKDKRKKAAFGTVALSVGAVVVAVGVGIGISRTVGGEDEGEKEPSAATPGSVTTMLVYGTQSHARSTTDTVAWMSLLSYNWDEKEGAVIYVPAHSATEVPGRGLLAVADAFEGGVPLLLVSVEGILGIDIDRHLELSEQDARLFFQRVGELEVNVPIEVRESAGDGNVRVLLDDGPQRLNSDFLIHLLFTVGIDGDDQELGSRHLAFWDALFAAFGDEPEELARIFEASDPAVAKSNATVEANAAFLAALARIPREERTITLLPVSQVSVGDSELYEVNEEDTEALITEAVGRESSTDELASVQILNGNGVPGIGEEVAQDLVGNGFRVEVSSNAQSFDHRRTLIIVYDDEPESLALAEQAKELLGVGRVRVQVQQQDIVDVTIVVGKDFLKSS